MLIEFNGEVKDVVDYFAEVLIKAGNAKKVEKLELKQPVEKPKKQSKS